MSCVGCPETATFDTTAPKRIDGDGSVALVEAAAAAGVKQFVMVTSLGTGKFGLPAGVLNLFWGVLNEKRKAEQVCLGETVIGSKAALPVNAVCQLCSVWLSAGAASRTGEREQQASRIVLPPCALACSLTCPLKLMCSAVICVHPSGS